MLVSRAACRGRGVSRALLRHRASRAYTLARARGLTPGALIRACTTRAARARCGDSRAVLCAIAERAKVEIDLPGG